MYTTITARLQFGSKSGCGATHGATWIRLHLDLNSCGVSALVGKVSHSLSRSRLSRRLHFGHESLAFSAFGCTCQAGRAVAFWLAPFPNSRRLLLGRKNLGVSISVAKIALSPPRSRKSGNGNFWSALPGRSCRCILSRAVSWFAPYPLWSRQSPVFTSVTKIVRDFSWSCRLYFLINLGRP